jgi:DNA-binding NtrC family response regulator
MLAKVDLMTKLPTASVKILIVDDEPEICELIAEVLAELGVEILTAPDGVRGLELIREHRPKVILSDFNMPKMNGLELLKSIRSEQLPGMVIWLTGRGSQSLHREAYSLGVYDYFEKPTNLDQLKEVVAGALSLSELSLAEIKPMYMMTSHFKELSISLDVGLFEKLSKDCLKMGVAPSSWINEMLAKYYA